MSEVAERLEAQRARLHAACSRSGRDPGEVTLIAVSKTFGPEAVREAYAAGQRDFGESYAQELRDKSEALRDCEDLRWHYLGPIQTNKVRYLVGRARRLHAIDRPEAARAVSERAQRDGLPPVACLLAVNLGDEETKHGVAPEGAEELLAELLALPGLQVDGLFCLPPWSEEAEASRPFFARLRALRDGLRKKFPGRALTHLSMGMSHDFEVAIEEGATMVRVGTAIFGTRERKG